MVEPVFIATLAAGLISKYAESGMEAISEKLAARVSEAKKQHAEMHVDPELPVEINRSSCLRRICNIQQDIVLYVSDIDFLKRVLPLTLDLIGNIYEANTKQELEILDMSISRIGNALTAYKNKKKQRKKVRLIAVVVSLFSLVGIGIFLWFSQYFGVDKDSTITIIMLPVPVLLWSIIGSFAAILYRFTNAGDSELSEPLRWLFARPLTGIIMGAIAYLILRVGLVTIQAPQSASILGSLEIMWLIAFLAGFSDRFSDYLLKNVVGKFGGSTDGDLITLEMSNKVTSTESNRFPFLNYLMPRNKENKQLKNVDKSTNGNSSPTETLSVSPESEKEVTSLSESKIKIVTNNENNK